MTDLTTNDNPLSPHQIRELVLRIGTKAEEFQALVTLLQPMLTSGEELPAETALALSNALHELEDVADTRDALNSMVDGYIAPALVLDEYGRVLSTNQGLRQQIDLSAGATLAQLGVTESAFEDFKARLTEHAKSTLLNLSPQHRSQYSKPLLMLGQRGTQSGVYLLVALQQHWPASIERAVTDLFGLSPRESAVLAGLASGLTLEDIALQHERKLSTVRQQTKSLLKKMGAATQTQAATLAAAASNAVNRTLESDVMGALPNQRTPWLTGEQQRDGRRIGWRRFGKAGGVPVLFVHGPSFGAGEFEHDRYWATHFGLDVVAIERPGYGRTDRPHRHDDALQCQVDDIQAVLDTLDVTPKRVVAHEVGLIMALAWAAQQPQPVQRIVGVSCAPPFHSIEQLSDMPAQQGIFILAARHAPWMAKLLLRLLVIRLRQLGSERWYEAVFGDVLNDFSVTQRPAFQQGVVAVYPFYTRQSGAGFEVDLQVMIRDWGHLVKECDVPLTLLHGTDNPTTPIGYLSAFKALNSRVTIQQIEDNGLTLALSEPERIYREVAKK